MVDEKLILEWIEKADEDFNFASSNLDEESTFFAQICFHFQQAAEKYLKAYIVAFELKFKKIHDLEELLNICREHNENFSVLKEECKFLVDFYIDTRYPVHWPAKTSVEEAKKARAAAGKIGKFVKKLLQI